MIKVWYQLYGKDGKPFQKCSNDKVAVSDDAIVDSFRKAVWAKNKDGVLKGISTGQLRVYMRVVNPDDQGASNASSLEDVDLSNQKLLDEEDLVNELSCYKAYSLVVVVPF